MNRLDFIEAADPPRLAPAEKFGGGARISRARIRIADIDGEEFQEAGLGPLPSSGNERRQGQA